MRGLLFLGPSLVVASLVTGCGLSDGNGTGGGFAPTSSSSSTGGGGGSVGGGQPVPTCTDGKQNGDETDVDCGGSCASCAIGQICQTSLDCAFGCEEHRCVAEPRARWTDVLPMAMPGPSQRYLQAVTYDGALKRTLLFGGSSPTAVIFNDTWAFDGKGWAIVNDGTQNAPPARYFAAMAFDAARAKTVLFGGQDAVGYRGDTWVHDASGWSQIQGAGPPARNRFAIAYDPNRRVTVVFGGLNGAPLDDTWEFDGAVWTNPMPTTRPAARYDASAAFDAAQNQVVLYGGVGVDGSAAPLADTWIWNGTSWNKVLPVGPTPGPRGGSSLASDVFRKRVILFGGSDGAGLHGDTWEWDGASWTPRPVTLAPPATVFDPLAFDADRHRAVLYLAYTSFAYPGQTWEYDVLATPCQHGTECGSGFCEDEVCCTSACGVCAACNGRATPGTCDIVVGREDPDSCHGDRACDVSGKCVPN